MEKSIENIIDEMLDEAQIAVKKNEGGMDDYIHTLQDSDTFFDEAHAIGERDALARFRKALQPYIDQQQRIAKDNA